MRGLGGSGGIAIPLCTEAAHLFPGIGLPTPILLPGNSLALGLWETELFEFLSLGGGDRNAFHRPGPGLLSSKL